MRDQRILLYIYWVYALPLTFDFWAFSISLIHGYADASFADIPDTRLSSIGYVFLVNGGAISWRSTKTPLHA